MKTISIVIAGLGGQGIVTASDILADAAFRAGFDVKKAEVHGMSQRGGSVNTDVRYGPAVLSPIVPDGEADVLVVMDPSQLDNNRLRLRPGGVLLTTDLLAGVQLPTAKATNVAMLGALSSRLELPEAVWLEAVRAGLPAKLHTANIQAFAAGRQAAGRPGA